MRTQVDYVCVRWPCDERAIVLEPPPAAQILCKRRDPFRQIRLSNWDALAAEMCAYEYTFCTFERARFAGSYRTGASCCVLGRERERERDME